MHVNSSFNGKDPHLIHIPLDSLSPARPGLSWSGPAPTRLVSPGTVLARPGSGLGLGVRCRVGPGSGIPLGLKAGVKDPDSQSWGDGAPDEDQDWGGGRMGVR